MKKQIFSKVVGFIFITAFYFFSIGAHAQCADTSPSGDCDNDSVTNGIDVDDDNDGILDTVEGSGAVDTDGDGSPDDLDVDSDGDGISDYIEAQDETGVILSASGVDSDGDGLDNNFEPGLPATSQDDDNDSTPDWRDLNVAQSILSKLAYDSVGNLITEIDQDQEIHWVVTYDNLTGETISNVEINDSLTGSQSLVSVSHPDGWNFANSFFTSANVVDAGFGIAESFPDFNVSTTINVSDAEGDGWAAIVYGDNIYLTNHHTDPLLHDNFYCVNKTTGLTCAGFPRDLPEGDPSTTQTNNRNTNVGFGQSPESPWKTLELKEGIIIYAHTRSKDGIASTNAGTPTDPAATDIDADRGDNYAAGFGVGCFDLKTQAECGYIDLGLETDGGSIRLGSNSTSSQYSPSAMTGPFFVGTAAYFFDSQANLHCVDIQNLNENAPDLASQTIACDGSDLTSSLADRSYLAGAIGPSNSNTWQLRSNSGSTDAMAVITPVSGVAIQGDHITYSEHGDQLFVSQNGRFVAGISNTHIRTFCWDVVTQSSCWGNGVADDWGAGSNLRDVEGSIVTYDAAGNPINVCLLDDDAVHATLDDIHCLSTVTGSVITSSGATDVFGLPTNLRDAIDNVLIIGESGALAESYYNERRNQTYVALHNADRIFCYDWAIDDLCADWGDDDFGADNIGDGYVAHPSGSGDPEVYAITPDFDLPGCFWVAGDENELYSFDLEGNSPCVVTEVIFDLNITPEDSYCASGSDAITINGAAWDVFELKDIDTSLFIDFSAVITDAIGGNVMTCNFSESAVTSPAVLAANSCTNGFTIAQNGIIETVDLSSLAVTGNNSSLSIEVIATVLIATDLHLNGLNPLVSLGWDYPSTKPPVEFCIVSQPYAGHCPNIASAIASNTASVRLENSPTDDAIVGPVDVVVLPVGSSNTCLGNISGLVWLDEDQDGINDIEETGFTNITVELQSSSCTPSVNCPTVVTDQSGNYVFADLLADSYNIVVITNTLPSDVTNTAGQYGLTTRAVTLGVGEDVSDEDFGYIADTNTGIIGDRIWSDADADGIQDLGEAGIANVTVNLLDSAGVIISTTVSNADGDYLFTNIPFGSDYVVQVDSTDPDITGFTPTTGPQSEGSFLSNPVTLSASLTTVTDVDFGFDSPATLSITDTIWYDSDDDQTQGVGEPGIEGVTVDLLDSSGNVVATAITDANGDFTFTGVPESSNYVLSVSDRDHVLLGMAETTNTGGDETIPGSLDTAAGGDDSLDTVGDDGTPTFGYNNPGTITGTVWSDADGNEAQNNGESGIGGIVVTITPPAGIDLGKGVGVAITTTTAADGSYIFEGLPPGSYDIDVLNPPAGIHTKDPDSDEDNNTTVVLGVGEGIINQDFGYMDASLFDISGTVFLDTDKDGVEEVDGNDGVNGTIDDEPGIAGVTVSLYVAGESDVINGMVDINDDGIIDINDDGIVGGVRIIDGMFDIDGNGNIDENDNGSVGTYDVVEGMISIAQSGTASQSSTGYEGDADPNVAIDGNPSGGVPEATFGPFIHTLGLITTDYWEVDLGSVQPLGGVKIYNRDSMNALIISRMEGVLILVSDTPFPVDPLDIAGAQTNADFTYTILAADLDDPVVNLSGIDGRYVRLQKSGVSNASDFLHFAELKVTPAFIEAPKTNVIASTTTDANGNYSFPGLPDGDYSVAVTDDVALLSGYDITSGLDELAVTLAGADVNDVDFGYIKDEATGSIRGEVFIDETVINGLADDNEANLSGVVLYLCSSPVASDPCDQSDPEYIGETTTDANGEYIFTGLLPDEYVVDADPTTIPASLTLTVDPAPVALSEGENVTDVDVGYEPATNTGVLSGFVWTDVDSDGVHDGGEAPISGVDIFVYTTGGALVATATTKDDGTWIVTGISGANLQDNLIIIYDSADIPADLESTQPTNLPLGVDTYAQVNLFSDADNNISNLDFAFPPTVAADLGSIAGTIYSDGNQDGGYQSVADGELQGVTLNLLNSGGDIIGTTTTDEDGNYLFSGLPDGDYTVEVSDLGNVTQDLNPNETISNPITIAAGADIVDQDAGYQSGVSLGSVGNKFWFDTNGDGIQQDDEPGLAGVVIQVWLDTDTSETPDSPNSTTNAPQAGVDNLVRTVTTDDNGEYYLTSLPAGQYTVVVFDSLGFTEGADGTIIPGGSGDGLAKPWTYALTKIEGVPNYTADFGVTGGNSLSGKIFIEDEALVEPALSDGDVVVTGDVELDGVTTPTGGSNVLDVSDDIPAAGVEVILLLEQPDGSFVEVQSTTTDVNGDYDFDGLPDGNYKIEVQTSGSVVDGFGQTGDPDLVNNAFGNGSEDLVCDSPTSALCDDATTVALSGDIAVADVNFGYQKNFTTTPVTVTLFLAKDIGNGVQFNWESSDEVGHLGYQIYARTGDDWVLLNETLISDHATGEAMQTRAYEFIAYNVDAQWFALVDVSVAEELTLHGPFGLDQVYGDKVIEPPKFDWNTLTRPAPKSKQQSAESRIARALQLAGFSAEEEEIEEESLDVYEESTHGGEE